MYSIGDLAQLAGVTPRMLRHYHELGILVPAEIDPSSGYRRYDQTQFADLMRLLALRDLGFPLSEVKRVIDGDLGTAQLRGMLLLRRAEVEQELSDTAARLERVERFIQRLENRMTTSTTETIVETKSLPAVHLAVASAVSPSFASADIGPVIQPLYPQLFEALASAKVEIAGPSIAYYEDAGEGGVRVNAGFVIDPTVTEVPGLEVVDLPQVPMAATAIHHGDMATVDVDTIAPIFDWISDHGFQTTGFGREYYIDCPDDISQWRTELQFPIAPDSA